MLHRFLLGTLTSVLYPTTISVANAEEAASPPVVHLHGRYVLAVNEIYNDAVGRQEIKDSSEDLSHTTVAVADSDSSVKVLVVQDGRRHRYSFDPIDGSIRADTTPSAVTDAIQLPGPAMKALVTAYASWMKGTISIVAHDSDLRSGTFESYIFPSHSGRTGEPGFIVSYEPIPTRYVGLQNCKVYRNTFVFSTDWRTVVEPFFC